MLLFSILALLYKRKSTFFKITILMSVILVSWQIYVVGSYSLSIISEFIANMFRYDLTLSDVSRMGFGGSPERSGVVAIRILSALILVLISASGLLYDFISSRRRSNLKKSLLPTWIVGNSSVVLLTSYSGEILSRAFSHSAGLLSMLSAKNIDSKRLSAILLVILLVFPPISLINAFGNESADYVSRVEIAGVEYFASHVSEGSQISTLEARIWGYHYSENYTRVALDPGLMDWSISPVNNMYFLIGERDLTTYYFLKGYLLNHENLTSIGDSEFYDKVYSCKGFCLYKGPPG